MIVYNCPIEAPHFTGVHCILDIKTGVALWLCSCLWPFDPPAAVPDSGSGVHGCLIQKHSSLLCNANMQQVCKLKCQMQQDDNFFPVFKAWSRCGSFLFFIIVLNWVDTYFWNEMKYNFSSLGNLHMYGLQHHEPQAMQILGSEVNISEGFVNWHNICPNHFCKNNFFHIDFTGNSSSQKLPKARSYW